MKTKKHVYILFIFLIITLAGCRSSQTSNSMANVNNNKNVIIKSGSIANSLEIIGLRDQNNSYCLNGSSYKNMDLYSMETTNTFYISSVPPLKFTGNARFNYKWLIWMENEDQFKNDPKNNMNGALYTQSHKTQKAIGIEIYKPYTPSALPVGLI